MAIKLTISSKELLEKQFSVAPRGYNPLEVDQYLDLVLRDYRTIEANCLVEQKEVDKLKATIAELEETIKKLEIDNAKYKQRFDDVKDVKNVNADNIDLIKRIRVLEKKLYSLGINPNTVK